jgi:hypothetical protein
VTGGHTECTYTVGNFVQRSLRGSGHKPPIRGQNTPWSLDPPCLRSPAGDDASAGFEIVHLEVKRGHRESPGPKMGIPIYWWVHVTAPEAGLLEIGIFAFVRI